MGDGEVDEVVEESDSLAEIEEDLADGEEPKSPEEKKAAKRAIKRQ